MVILFLIFILIFGNYDIDRNNIFVNESILMDNYVSVVVDDNNNVIIDDIDSDDTSNDIYFGNMSGYGPDCYGCSGYLAYGLYVGNGEIYYTDLEYGKVRIVAGDRSIPFGTIIVINNDILAIVLDRGGAIGFNKRFMFDLLYSSEEIANNNGILIDTSFEVLRYGF